MTQKRFLRLVLACTLAGTLALVATPAAEAASTAAAPTAPTNLRVTGLTPTTVTFQWDHSQGAQPGCTLQLILYAVYRDGQFLGWTYLGSPVGLVGGLRPGGTYRLAVQGRDNCSGQLSPLSKPLTVTTPRQ
jgi:hypothetical protein